LKLKVIMDYSNGLGSRQIKKYEREKHADECEN
jgi:hypothetical protein